MEKIYHPDVSRRAFLSGSGSAIALGAAAAMFTSGDALAQSATASPADLHGVAPTRFQDIGGVGLAYRRFGKEGATPVVCLQHFAGTMNNSDPIHTNRLAQDRPVILVDYRGVGRSEGRTPDSVRRFSATNRSSTGTSTSTETRRNLWHSKHY